MTGLVIEDARGERRASPDDFPLSLGGRGAQVELPGVEAEGAVAWLGLSDGELFLQAVEGGPAVTCNGMPVSVSQWLRAGDIFQVGEARVRLEADGTRLRLRTEWIEERAGDDPPVVVVADTPADESGDRAIRPVEFRPRTASGARRRRRVRVLPLVGVPLLLALLVMTGWIFMARRLQVQIDPPPDRVELQGGMVVSAPGGGWLLLPGTYTLVAEKEGYRRLEETLDVDRDAAPSLAFTLERLPGILVVDAGAIANAEVVVGEGPPVPAGGEIELEPGEHRILVRAPRYQELETMVSIEGAGSSQTVRADLLPRWSEIRVESEPAGATLQVDGEPRGRTPVTVELMPGAHRLELALEGHKPWQDRIRVEANQPQDLPRVRLVLQEGRLAVSSEPAGATVEVDGAFRGQTPMVLYLAPGADHEVEISKAGHNPATRDVRLGAGEAREWFARLEAREGEVQITASPADAELWVDGTRRGAASGVLRLPAVPHVVEIRKSGFLTHRVAVTPRPGYPQSIDVQLEPEVTDPVAAAPREIENSAGQTMVLVEGGRLRMGTSRREPGRRANETLREVELSRAFYLATTEVTNRQFRAFREEHLSGTASGHNLEIDDRPAVNVTWEDAAAYCNWLSRRESLPPAYVEVDGALVAAKPITAGYRLPLEAEWAWSARYHDGPEPRKYPWGSAMPVPPGAGNFADASARGLLSRILENYDDGFPVTAPVDRFTPNGLGIFNLGGNVSEWMHDIYGIPPSSSQAVIDPTGAEEGELHVIRGSSWMHATISELRLTFRNYGKKPRPDVGFRVARYLE